MYDYHPDLVCILFVRSHPYILLHFKEIFFLLVCILFSDILNDLHITVSV